MNCSPASSLSLASLQLLGTRQSVLGPGEHFSCQGRKFLADSLVTGSWIHWMTWGGDEVDLGVILQHFINPVEESVQEFRVVLQPRGVVEEAEGSSVLVEVSVEVVGQEVVELVTRSDVGAGVNHCTSRQVLVHSGVLPPVQLVDNNLP